MSTLVAAGAGPGLGPATPPLAQQAATAVSLPEVYAKDAIIGWYKGEFAAANAIIDALCGHLAQISVNGVPTEYDAAFAAIHRRRMNWIPVLHLQKYFSIADVAVELRRVEARRVAEAPPVEKAGKGTGMAEVKKEIALEPVPSPKIDVADAGAEVEVKAKVKAEEETEVKGEAEEEAPAAEQEEVKAKSEVKAEEEAEVKGEAGEEVQMAEEVEVEVEDSGRDDSSDQAKVQDCAGSSSGSTQEEQYSSLENIQICSDHEGCTARLERIKTCKGFVAKEPVKGHMVNVVKGLKLYEDMFLESEVSRLGEFINDLRVAGHSGELSGETFIFFNKQLKGNKREIIQLGVPVFQPTKEEAASNIEPIPSLLQDVIDHLVQWRLIPESRKPNSCVINFFDEDEFSQPYYKPPHLDNPISTLLLCETTMAFGRSLVSCHNGGNYKGSLTLPIKEGSLLVMRGNSADMARHVVCPSSNPRVCISFLRVRPSPNQIISSPTAAAEQSKAMTLWKPSGKPQKAATSPTASPTATPVYGPQCMSPTWGMAIPAPIVMLGPPRPMVMSPTPTRKMTRNGSTGTGTGVFLPWTVGPKKYIKHLPPRIQRRRMLSLPSPMEMQEKASQIPCIVV